MSKLIKGIGKAVKGIVKGIGKIFKKITKSTIGKVLFAAAAIYLGGAAFGLWESPFQAVNGAFVSSGSVAGETLTATSGTVGGGASVGAGEVAAAESTLASTAAGASTASAAPATVATGSAVSASPLAVQGTLPSAAEMAAAGVGGGSEIAATGLGLAEGTAASTILPETMAATSATGAGATGGILSKVAGFVGKHKTASLLGAAALASGFGVDELDVLGEEEKLRSLRSRKAFGGIGKIDLGFKGKKGAVLKTSEGAPVYGKGGILERLRQRSRVFNGG